jgi:two-component system sensor histidine kinase HupT/HoxJ
LNLVNNAFQALGGRAGRLEIRSSRRGDHVVVEFLDSGPGIAPEHMHRIFDPFFTTKPLGEGTGLGLSISYGIVQQHRGSIAAYNRPEGGAVFVIELPIQGPGEPEESPDRSGDAEFAVAPSSSDQHT